MRPLRSWLNLTLDGCAPHEAGIPPDQESMACWTEQMLSVDADIFGRVTYQMRESAWRRPASGRWTDWNTELLRGDPIPQIRALKEQPGRGLSISGVTLPLALAEAGQFDEYEFLIQPMIAGHGPTLLAGLRGRVPLELVDRRHFDSGAVALRYRPAPLRRG